VNETRSVLLPADLCAKVESRFAHKFANVEELLIFLMNDLVCDESTKADEAEQRLIEERLQELGYL
jgi:hypothetical protein